MVTCLATLALTPFFLHSGDRVCFYGDSITEQRFYTLYVEAFVRTRYPKLDVTFASRGWGGDASWGGGGGLPSERVAKDVAPFKPTVVTIMLGMNDGGYSPYDEKVTSAFREWYGKLIGEIETAAPKARLTFIGTSPWDDYAHEFPAPAVPPAPWHQWHGYNEVLQRYEAVPQGYATKLGAPFVDFNAPLVETLKKAHATNSALAVQIIPDAIHPGPAGHILMAGELLKGWHVDPLVSQVVINAAELRATTQKSKVKGITKDKGTLSWKQLDDCLPFAMDPEDEIVKLVLASSNFTDELNREKLTVGGLNPGTYALTIDGAKVGVFDSHALSEGVNLALFDTPMRKQSLKVLELARRRSDTDFLAWRSLSRPDGDLKLTPNAVRAVEAVANELDQDARNAAHPTEHTYQLTLVQ